MKKETDPMETFDMGYHEFAKEQYKKRVADNPNRIQYAIEQFEKHNIEYALKNEQTGHFIVEENPMINYFSFMREQAK